MENKVPSDILCSESEVLSRRDYQEILLAKLAGGDLYAMETLQKLRKVDMALDRLRIAFGDKPLYKKEENP